MEWIRETRERMADQARTNAQALPEDAVDQYDAILVQNEFRVIQKTTTDPGEILQQNLSEAIGLAARNAANPNIRLVCFPEFFMTGSGGAGFRTPSTLERIAITYPGPELDEMDQFLVDPEHVVSLERLHQAHTQAQRARGVELGKSQPAPQRPQCKASYV